MKIEINTGGRYYPKMVEGNLTPDSGPGCTWLAFYSKPTANWAVYLDRGPYTEEFRKAFDEVYKPAIAGAIREKNPTYFAV